MLRPLSQDGEWHSDHGERHEYDCKRGKADPSQANERRQYRATRENLCCLVRESRKKRHDDNPDQEESQQP